MRYLAILFAFAIILFVSGCVDIDVDADADKWQKYGEGYAERYTPDE